MVKIKSMLMAAALVLSVLVWQAPAGAQDRIELKDGRVMEGTIVREVEGYFWIRARIGGLERELMFTPDEIAEVKRTTKAPEDSAPEAAAPKPKQSPEARPGTGATRAAIISLGENPSKSMVGLYVTAESLRQAIPLLEQEGVELVVFHIDSPGGYTLEVQRISDVIQNEFKPRFQVVAWVRSAISAAAMITHTIEEIYFMPQAGYGAATEFSGEWQASKERPLEERLAQMERISARGGHDPAIMRSMQIMEPLSCTIDEHGDVHWSNTTDGQFVVNPTGRVLTFNATDAVKFGFARGIASDHHELAKEMGFTEIEWLGRAVRGVPYPVSRAEEGILTFRERTHTDVERTNEYFTSYGMALNLAAQAAPDQRGPFLGRAQTALNRIDAMVRNNSNLALFVMNMTPNLYRDWLEQQRERIRELRRR